MSETTTAYQSIDEPILSSDDELGDEESSNPRETYETFLEKLASFLNGLQAQPRVFIQAIIFHEKAEVKGESFKEKIPLTKFVKLIRKRTEIDFNEQIATAIRKVHAHQTMIDVATLIEDLKTQGCVDAPPENKKHLVFSTLTPESIMILKRLASFSEQKKKGVDEILRPFSF